VVSDFAFCELLFLAYLFIQLTASHEVEDEDDAVLLLVDLVDVDDAGVIEADQHVDFVAGFDQKGLVNFGSEDLAGVSAEDLADSGLSAVWVEEWVRPRTSRIS
jgi:hypothetical protein